jgi:hypothetical protein
VRLDPCNNRERPCLGLVQIGESTRALQRATLRARLPSRVRLAAGISAVPWPLPRPLRSAMRLGTTAISNAQSRNAMSSAAKCPLGQPMRPLGNRRHFALRRSAATCCTSGRQSASSAAAQDQPAASNAAAVSG